MRLFKLKKKVIIGAEIIVLILVGASLYGLARKNNDINREINSLEIDIDELGQRELELNELVKYFDSQAYLEQKARLELGLQKPGESIVILNYKDPDIADRMPINSYSESIAVNKKPKNNLFKWFNYLFPN
ncbi:MAG: hypothetical protein COT81_02245 [Candidatus Buchananbacteria bacterium CG10_big_fil_rev_8_21_14_0_10_42_9]|uniref:Septum formation initiator n=1 Tax=Candidatus Buchananbacteria bacterium CG10_big_fil_rev_8_21_14_0_10_42_9 TaxID=1974526 RepID=A0A2H0W1H5_9BACT|nr:MAG: hypothetical protein COT81_02245 [Candidatus Buchananbacteria bacterium CG10_big_fil_rev_8_21_14_0_10_42_9]